MWLALCRWPESLPWIYGVVQAYFLHRFVRIVLSMALMRVPIVEIH
jgi:hypothetical protein